MKKKTLSDEQVSMLMSESEARLWNGWSCATWAQVCGTRLEEMDAWLPAYHDPSWGLADGATVILRVLQKHGLVDQ